MAAPKFVPVPATDTTRGYASPDHVPDPWVADRPGELAGRQPVGRGLGVQGPDQGYALVLAERLRPDLHLQTGESADDALQGALNVALRRASMFGRAPVIHDLVIALTIWGFLDPSPPADLVATRRPLFEGVAKVVHHYAEGRRLAAMVPQETLRMSRDEVTAAYPAEWRDLTGT
jgi:hypothetical protein